MKKNRMYFKFLIMRSLLTTDLITGIRVVYMLSFNISEGEITLLKGIYSLVVALAEIPTGIISDRFSKKLSLQIGAILFTIHAIFYVAMPNFAGFFLTQFILALSAAFLSGAEDGYIDDYIKHYTNDEFLDVVGKIEYIGSFISAGIYLSSGILFSINNMLNFIILAVIGILVFAIISKFPSFEVLEKNEKISENKLSSYISDVKNILIYSVKNKMLLKITIVSSFIIALLIFNFEYYQILLNKFSFPNELLGVLYASFMILCGIGSKISNFLVKKMKIDVIGILFMILISVSYAIFAFSDNLILIVMGIIIQQICFGSWSLIAQSTILEHIPAEETKSTMLSMNSLMVSLLRSVLVLLLGGVLFIKGYVFTYILMMGIMIFAAIVLLSIGRKKSF